MNHKNEWRMYMKKLLLATTITALIIAIYPKAVSAAGTLQYSGDIVSFEYAEDLYGTIEYLEQDSTIYYNCESFSGNYSVSIRVINFDGYEQLTGVGKDEYVDFIIKNEDNAAFTINIVEESDYPERKSIEKMEGNISYTKIIGESPTGFILVELDEINENESIIGDMFRNIYDSVSATDEWIKNGNSVPENSGYSRMIFGNKKD